jgi:DNA-binding MarR family transcriptional regulator/N-acetylglutamate synthase-like GNAT family acetyltransferase
MDKFIQFKELALASRLKRLSDSFMKDAKKIYKILYIDFEPSLMPVFKTINDEKEISIGEIAKVLDISQPAVTQFVKQLQKKGLITIISNTSDKRKKNITLSKKGLVIIEKLHPIWSIIQKKVQEITIQKPASFLEQLSNIERQQKEYSIFNRVLDHLKTNVEIVPFEEKYAYHFYNLNAEWLNKYFYIEPYDKKVLSNPKKHILDSGGFIFFAKFNGEIAGVVSIINQKNFFELSKMAVSPKYQGLKIGRKLMNYCINFAKEQKWERITLYSHRNLVAAISLYKKVGFEEIKLEENSHYERSDIKMLLKLN